MKFNKHRIVWAANHDWFIKATLNMHSNVYTVFVKNDMVTGEVLKFTDFNELKNWAGY